MSSLDNTDGHAATYTSDGPDNRIRAFYNAAWRWHFYAGLYVIPFLIMLAVTGAGMVIADQFDDRFGVARSIQPGDAAIPVTEQAAAAAAAVPAGTVTQYVSPRSADQASLFTIADGEESVLVSVNPYTGEVVDMGAKSDSLYALMNDIHGSLLIGDTGDMLIEIAAGLGVLLIVTGAYLWWPRGAEGSIRSAFVPNLAAKGRPLWKELHRTVGFWISALLLVFLLTGLSWTGVWGGQFVQAWSTFPAEKWENVPLSDETHAAMNHGALEEVPWGLEQTPLPASGSEQGVAGVPDGVAVNLDSIAWLARALGLNEQFRVDLPRDESGVYTISADTISGDTTDPTGDRTLHVDQYTGKILAEVGFADYSPGAKAMAVGIAFHQGDMGLWNAILNIVYCLAVVFLAISGVVMWWKRRPARMFRLAAPPLPHALPLWKGAVLIGLFLSLAFPLVGVTLLIVLALDFLVFSRVPGVRKFVG